MDAKQIESIISECYNLGDFSSLVTKLSYEDRYSLFTGTITTNAINNILSLLVPYLFTPQEAEDVFFKVEDQNKKKNLFFILEDKIKIMVIDELDINEIEINKYIQSASDERIKFRLAMYFLVNNKILEFSLSKVIGILNNEFKLEFFNKMIEFYSEKGEKFNVYLFPEIIEAFDEKERVLVIKKLVDKNGEYRLNWANLPKILKTVSEEDRRECLLMILDNNKDRLNEMYNVCDIMKLFSEENIYTIIKDLVDSKALKSYALLDYLKDKDINRCLEIIDFVIDYEKNNESKVINNNTISKLLDRVPRDIGVKIYKKYTIDMEQFANISVAKGCHNIEDRYFYIDYLLSTINIVNFDKIFETLDLTLVEMDEIPLGTYEYANIIDMYVKKYQVNRNHLVEFIKRFNYSALKFMNSKNIRDAINLEETAFYKFIEIFNSKGTELTNDVINTICNSFLQRQFSLENDEDYNIFSRFEDVLRNKDENTIIRLTELLVKIGKTINIDLYLEKENISIDDFIELLLGNNGNTITILHNMTQEYIMKKREEYVKKELVSIFDKLVVNKKIEKNLYKKKLLELNTGSSIRSMCRSIPEEYLTEDEKFLLENRDIFMKVFEFKKSHNNFEPELKKYLKVFESLLNKYYEYKYDEKKLEQVEEKVYTYSPIPVSDDFLLGVILECNISQIAEKLLTNEELYNKLLNIIQKYKLLGWEKTFSCFEDSAEVTFTEGTMASIISNFYSIEEITRKNNSNLTEFLDYANCYDSISKIYSYILGKDNYRLIAANEGRNKSNVSKAERIGRLPRLIKGMYDRTEITTPPIDKDYETSTGKKINVVLGNSTNMINLSYGERTNSCLRIGGAFNDLFEFCIHNKNGFHVRFTDPKTGKFISRVSGIRNGNTIFFNELRDSENKEYTNEEIIEALKSLSSELIESTKNEECPIENVVISYDYAMRDYEKRAVPSKLSDYPDAFYGLRFNIKPDGNFVVLKTTHPANQLVPYKFGADLARSYETQRDKIVEYEKQELAQEKIAQLYLLNGILKGQEVEDIEYQIPSNIKCFISGEDWYVYLDEEGNINEFILDSSKHKDRALEEMKNALQKINAYIEEKNPSQTLGGF